MKKVIAWILVFGLLLGQTLVQEVEAEENEEIYNVSIELTYNQTEARQMLSLVNDLRQDEATWYWGEDNTTKIYCGGLEGLTYDYELEKVAMRRAAEIALYYSHTRPNRGNCWSAYSDTSIMPAGENIAAGQDDYEIVYNAWAESDEDYAGQGHRRNMLNENATSIGIGCVIYRGQKYWVQEFGRNTSGLAETVANDSPESASIELAKSTCKDVSVSLSEYQVVCGETLDLTEATVSITTDSDFLPVRTVSADIDWSLDDTDCAELVNDQLTATQEGTVVLTADTLGTSQRIEVQCVADESELVVPGEYEEDGWGYYLYKNGTVKITSIANAQLEEIVVPETLGGYPVTELDSFLFNYVSPNIKSVQLPNTITTIGQYCFQDLTSLETINMPTDLTSIGYYAFDGCENLESITLPAGLKSLGSASFWGCKKIESVTIPASVTSIGSGAFADCSSLKRIVVEEGNLIYDSNDDCNAIMVTETDALVAGCDNTVFSDRIQRIESNSFVGCMGLKKIEIGKNVTYIGNQFTDCDNVEEITVSEENTVYDSRDNCNAVIETATNRLITTCKNTVLVEGISVIYSMDQYIKFHDEIVLPDSVTTIEGTFYGCENLKKITFGKELSNIGDSTFLGCTGLMEVVFPEKVRSVGEFAFSGCTNLEKIELNEGLERIGESAFAGTNIKEIHIPASVSSIGLRIFGECNNLDKITVSKENITYDSRENCNAIIETDINSLVMGCKSTVIPNSVETLIGRSFFQIDTLERIHIPSSVKTIGPYAFQSCDNLKRVTFDEGLESIGTNAFSFCNSLKFVRLPKGTTELWDGAFMYCQNLLNAEIPSSVIYIGNNAFDSRVSIFGEEGSEAYDYAAIMGHQFYLTEKWDEIALTGEFEIILPKYEFYCGESLDLSDVTVNFIEWGSDTAEKVEASKLSWRMMYEEYTLLPDNIFVAPGEGQVTLYAGYSDNYSVLGAAEVSVSHKWDEGKVSEDTSTVKVYTCEGCGETKEEPYDGDGGEGDLDKPGATSAPSEPMMTSAPSEPMVTSAPSEPMMTSAPSEPMVTSAPSEPMVTSAPSEPMVTSTPSEPMVTSVPSEPTVTSVPKEPNTSSEPDAPSETNAPSDLAVPGEQGTSSEMAVLPAKNTKLKASTGDVYTVIKAGKKNGTVAYTKPKSKKCTKVTIPATVTIEGVTYKVVAISNHAFKKCTKLRAVTIGKNVTKIGKGAFQGCKNLKKITIKTTTLKSKSIGAKAFKGTNKRTVVKVSKKVLKKYKKFLYQSGLSKKATIRK